MKHILSVVILSSCTLTFGHECSITVTPQWNALETRTKKEQKNQFQGEWVLVGSITFCKKIKDPVKLQHLSLYWHGDPLDNLTGSLYKKRPDKEFMPLEENVVCDSSWNKEKQKLIFTFNHKPQSLGPRSIFYLVLTVPPTLENILKRGHFSLTQQELPEPFDHQEQTIHLDLAQLQIKKEKKSIS